MDDMKLPFDNEPEYCKKHDAYFDPYKDKWLESQCPDKRCWWCRSRPSKPSQVNW